MHHDWLFIVSFIFVTIGLLVSVVRLLRTGRKEYYFAKVRGKESQISRRALVCQTVSAALILPWSAYRAFAGRENAILENWLLLLFTVGIAISLLSSILIKDTWKPRSTQ